MPCPYRKGKMLMTLLEIFRNPGKLAEISFSAKLMGALQITMIGMALTFIALVLVWLTVRLLARFAAGSPPRERKPVSPARLVTVEDEGEKIAAIAAVLTLFADRTPDRIRVRRIIRGPDGGRRWMDG